MLKLNCLINDTQAVQFIKDAMQILVGERVDSNKSISFPAIYSELRKKGLEVDAESAGKLYNEVYGHYNDPALSTEGDILSYVGKDVADVQQSIVDAILDGTPGTKQVQIGKLPDEVQVATNIARVFKDTVFGTTKKVNSVMKQMEVLVNRAAKNLLPPGQQKQGASLYDNLLSFFSTEKVEFQRLDGSTNTLRTLHNATKDEVESYLNNVTDKLSDEDADALRQQWEEYTDAFIQSTYDIMLGRSDQNKLLNEALKKIDVPGFKFVDVNDNIKWNTLLEFSERPGASDAIAQAVKKLFQQGVKDEAGDTQKYSPEQAERIGNYVQRLYNKKMAEVVQKKIGNVRAKNISAKNIVSDFIKDSGFINLVKDKDGKLLLTQANWDDALKHMQLRAGDKEGVDHAAEKLREFLKTKTNKDGNPFTANQVAIIEEHFRDAVAAKLTPATATPGDLEKLIALKNLNNGRAFQKETQTALNKVLGVSNLDQDTINKIEDLVAVIQSIKSGNNVDDSTSADPAVNRGAWAFQMLSQLERRIKEIIHAYKISADPAQAQRVVKYTSDLMNAASASLLENPVNILENVTTSFGSNLAESVLMAVTHRKLFRKVIGTSQGDFWRGFASHLFGGVANEVIAEGESNLDTDLPVGERLRASALIKEFQGASIGSFIGTMLKIPSYAASIAARAVMNDVDAGFNSAIWRKKAAQSIFTALKAQGFTTDKVYEIMDKAFNLDAKSNKELDDINAEIRKKMNRVGVYPTDFDMALNKSDMKMSFYVDAMRNANEMAGSKISARQVGEATKALIESSQLQAKVLLGKKNIPSTSLDFLNQFIYGRASGMLGYQRKAFKEQQELEAEGKLTAAAASQFEAESYKNTFGRFVGGIANFMALAVTTTPYGFLTATSLHIQKKRIKNKAKENVADVFAADPGDIRKYAEAHQLMRSMIARATIGTLVTLGFIAKYMLDDDDDETWIGNLLQTASGRRLVQKTLPVGVNIAAATLYDINDKKMDSKMERLLELAGNITGQRYNTWESIKMAVNKVTKEGEAGEAIGGIVGNKLSPTANINQAEQVTKFWNVLKSAYDKKYINDVQRDEEISKLIYKQQEGFVDAFLTNGGIDAFGRWIGVREGGANRFSNDKK